MRQHGVKLINDKIAIVGELEHLRRHALRSFVSTAVKALDDDSEELAERSAFYLVTAMRAQSFRRQYMDKHFPDMKDEDWCLGKSAATLRQLMYESEQDGEMLPEIDRFVDEIWGNALDADLTGCIDCQQDREEANGQGE